MITVTKPHVPDQKKFNAYAKRAFDSGWLTNDGPLVRELTIRLQEYLGVRHLLLVANGTLGLLVALKVARCAKVLTTPFSFPATTSAPLWADIAISYGDINPSTFNLVVPSGENVDDVDAILPTHVYGIPCDVEKMDLISKKWEVPVIYDAAHAFAVKTGGRSVLEYGDMSVLSFHATKLFHCVEGGAIKFRSEQEYLLGKEMINFGYDSSAQISSIGINAKMNELEAAMGLAMLDEIDRVLVAYREIYETYDELLAPSLQRQSMPSDLEHNYSYFPICFKDSNEVAQVISRLNESNIFPRRYFAPSLDEISVYGQSKSCEVSRNVASRVLCLPIYSTLGEADVRKICQIVNQTLEQFSR